MHKELYKRYEFTMYDSAEYGGETTYRGPDVEQGGEDWNKVMEYYAEARENWIANGRPSGTGSWPVWDSSGLHGGLNGDNTLSWFCWSEAKTVAINFVGIRETHNECRSDRSDEITFTPVIEKQKTSNSSLKQVTVDIPSRMRELQDLGYELEYRDGDTSAIHSGNSTNVVVDVSGGVSPVFCVKTAKMRIERKLKGSGGKPFPLASY